MIMEKKVWPELFENVRNAKFEIRLADIIVFKEWDPKTKKYTGRSITRKVTSLKKDLPTRFWTTDEIEKFGLYIIGLSQ